MKHFHFFVTIRKTGKLWVKRCRCGMVKRAFLYDHGWVWAEPKQEVD